MSIQEAGQCVICKQRTAVYPRSHDEKKICKQCWEHRMKAMRSERDKFIFDRFTRTPDTETYFIRHPLVDKEDPDDSGLPACGELIVIQWTESRFRIYALLKDNFRWDDVAVRVSDEDNPLRLSTFLLRL